MKKTTFNISFDEDKASALVLYLSQKGTSAEAELERALDVLYGKTVPAGVREFIDMRSGTVSLSAVPKPKKPKPLCRPVWRDTATNRVNTSPRKQNAVWDGFRPALRKSAGGTKISR